MTPYETRSMRAARRALAALRMVWASAAWMAVEMLATCPVCVPGSRLPPVSFYRYRVPFDGA